MNEVETVVATVGLIVTALALLMLFVHLARLARERRAHLHPAESGGGASLTHLTADYAELRLRVLDEGTGRPAPELVAAWRREAHAIDERRARAASRFSAAVPLLPAVVSLLPVLAALLAVLDGASGAAWAVGAGALVLTAVALVLGVRTGRRAADVQALRALAAERHRDRLTAALDDAERRSGRRVPGLGDRVARALAILREQQP